MPKNYPLVKSIVREAIEKGALQKPRELEGLLKTIIRERPRVVVEIGTARGGTFYALCQVAPDDATIVSIDLPGGPFGGGYNDDDIKVFKTFKKSKQHLHFIRQDSHLVDTVRLLLKTISKKKIDFLLIDGDHTYPGVRQDWNIYAPLVRNGGMVALHDIVFHEKVPECQVDRLWMELRAQIKNEFFIDKDGGPWGGIGVFYMGEKPQFTEKKSHGLLLDLSPVPFKQAHFTGMAGTPHPNVDIVHDLEKFPWPFKNNSCHLVVGHFIIQKIKPWLMIPFMDEVWRIVRPGGQLALSAPYGSSPFFYADPLNCHPVNESTFFYFDPQFTNLYGMYKPKPWMIEKGSPQWSVNGNLEVAMRPRK